MASVDALCVAGKLMPDPDADAAAPPTPSVVVMDGKVANTNGPLPVSSVIAAARLADDGASAQVPTAATAKLIVPELVMGPPDKPVPVPTLETVPPKSIGSV